MRRDYYHYFDILSPQIIHECQHYKVLMCFIILSLFLFGKFLSSLCSCFTRPIILFEEWTIKLASFLLYIRWLLLADLVLKGVCFFLLLSIFDFLKEFHFSEYFMEFSIQVYQILNTILHSCLISGDSILSPASHRFFTWCSKQRFVLLTENSLIIWYL